MAEPEKRSKAEWRRWAKEVRAGLETLVLSREVVAQLEHSSLYKGAGHILSYLAFSSEISLSELHLPGTGKHFYATRTAAGGALSVHSLAGVLERHPYGFDEPGAGNPEVELRRLELLLVPGLAFDRSGTRLGYGRGFYDRLLLHAEDVPVVGVVPSTLIVPALPAEPHDVRMTHLLSEQDLFAVTKG